MFNDNRTAFIVTADHGMTDRGLKSLRRIISQQQWILLQGSHGDGDDYETQTPIVAWGAGIPKYAETTATSQNLFSIVGSTKVPRFDVKQIDIAPLMSSLLGIPVPVNSYGQLPLAYLNTSKVRQWNCGLCFVFNTFYLSHSHTPQQLCSIMLCK